MSEKSHKLATKLNRRDGVFAFLSVATAGLMGCAMHFASRWLLDHETVMHSLPRQGIFKLIFFAQLFAGFGPLPSSLLGIFAGTVVFSILLEIRIQMRKL